MENIVKFIKAIIPQCVICAVTYIGCHLCIKGISLFAELGKQTTSTSDISFLQMMPAVFLFLVAIVCFYISRRIVSSERKALQQRYQIENSDKCIALADKYISLVDKTDDSNTKNELIRAIRQAICVIDENDV